MSDHLREHILALYQEWKQDHQAFYEAHPEITYGRSLHQPLNVAIMYSIAGHFCEPVKQNFKVSELVSGDDPILTFL